jgi:hypothetical protein
MVFIFIPLIGNNIKACHALQHHVLVMELDMDVFTKVLEPLVVVPIPEVTRLVVNIDDEYSTVERRPKKILDCE